MPSVTSYTHTQSTASTTWNINHNCNTLAPVIDVFVTVGAQLTKILPLNVVVTDKNNVVVTFSSARSGSAAVR